MVDVKEFRAMQQEIAANDAKREQLIKDSRDVVVLSKKIIYSTHRSDMTNAKKFIVNIKKNIASLKKQAVKTDGLKNVGAYKVALQEYVEAIAFYEYVKNGTLTNKISLGVDTESYLLGICDLVGELTRYAVNSITRKDLDTPKKVLDFVQTIYGLMMEFDFRNSELRKKFDSIKYNLKKLEEINYDISIR
ncbi:hypothetical protein GOV04_01985 [Candidatus Woesearchaeota archaeon]|nr:hypothetical protein [Candidatus Woesearchaeota archaeon]